MKSVKKNKMVILSVALLFIALVGLLFVAADEAYAEIPSTMNGTLFATVDGSKVLLPGVRIIRVDSHAWPECEGTHGGKNCFGTEHVIEVYSRENGRFHMGNIGNWPDGPICTNQPDNNGLAHVCPTTNVLGTKKITSPCTIGEQKDDLNY